MQSIPIEFDPILADKNSHAMHLHIVQISESQAEADLPALQRWPGSQDVSTLEALERKQGKLTIGWHDLRMSLMGSGGYC